MGILQSILQYWSYETDKDENAISTLNSYNDGEKLTYSHDDNGFASSHHKWQDGNKSILSPDLKHTNANNKEKSSDLFINQNTPQNVERGDRTGKQRGDGAATIKCNVVSAEGNKSILSPDLKHTNANNKEKSSDLFINQNTPQNVERGDRTGKQRGDGAATIKCNVVSAEVRWIKHYISCHQILVVGDGDFSFSTCLAAAFGWASNMIATSRDSKAFLLKNYRTALSNLVELSIRKCKVMHKIDATKMCTHPYLGGIKFDRVVFNFPFAGLFKDISRDSQLRRHRKLVSQFLMNAKKMISETGEIHITHKTSEFQMEWKVESMASSHGLRLVEAVDFNLLDYPGYNTKYGFGGDKNFNCYPSKTYKFGLRF